MQRRRYALLGAGMRAHMYTEAIASSHADTAELVAVGDSNPGRAGIHADIARNATAGVVRVFRPAELESVIADDHVDRVIITSPDFTHAEYIERALRAGADVVVEKPLTIDAEGCRRIDAAVRETGRDVVITFNYRYAPRNTELRRVISSGTIGRVTSVHFEWVLDTQHGADYFRRWHREKANSGGLFVHKASHHFDLVNWWLDAAPTRVYARGGLRFYGDRNAAERGLGDRPSRGSIDGGGDDPFSLDLRDDGKLRRLYLDQEHWDGYHRDQDVFGPGITIEDNLSALVDYDSGATLSYSLNAHSPWEGYTVSVNGTEGRAELRVVERGAVGRRAHIDPSAVHADDLDDSLRPTGDSLIVQRHWEAPVRIDVPTPEGGHGGGDLPLLRDVFDGPGDDDLSRAAGYIDGIRSVAVGIAGNISLADGRPVDVADLALGVDLSRTRP